MMNQVKTQIPGTRILVVDDDEISQELQAKALENAGFQVECCSDGLEGWSRLLNEEFRIVLLDWEMPGISGFDLCKRIRESNFRHYIYIIMVSSRNRSEDLVAGLSAGADDFITKPFNPEELRVRVRAGERILALDSRDSTIFAMATLAESRDPETGNHLHRIQSYSQILAFHLSEHSVYADQIDSDYVQMIGKTSPLHDIGKIGIPDAILLKPGQFNDEEFDIMKTHTLIGGKTLESVAKKFPQARYLQMATDIALYHHERYDGSGYPTGLSGDQIPLCARIIALADVYDALTSKRHYKDAFSHILSSDMIMKGSGSHFDPVVVESFEACKAMFEKTAEVLRSGAGEED